MNWISIKDGVPKKGEQVLVFGHLETELGGRANNPCIGLVEWGSIEESECSDMCYYDMNYQDITHWCNVPKEPNQTAQKSQERS